MSGCFYFISNRFYDDFSDSGLMRNKKGKPGELGGRPCFFAFQDSVNSDIFWLIPISSKLEKYKMIQKRITEKHKSCNTLYFCNVLGKERVFLIQNMFPITRNYIEETYLNQRNEEVKISSANEKQIIRKAKTAFRLHHRGKNIFFVDIEFIKKELIKKLNPPNP
ncbi:type III toxin-antitoxin system CptIN family toxin [Methanimicrococcus blatticola]|uniref:Uncharacterized protein n=1 Tax=Methanimicrococcus blatticola TaxID=91560 RepID=A0A484F3X1_9EURY|nr:hypothetical protein [Methanimicrococcus blatticola]MBZ3935856.1 hypothetical protein [Methanimicrococcus blatticola]MCC2508023.1 hypothetical protein [Methanimicrococcus blatticola]TDQ68894.1 hypothetical protein C7391_1093 [Methanimicrococcus blatticola]